MYGIVEKHQDITRPHSIRILNGFQGFTKGTLSKLADKNWITIQGQDWALTEEGFETAENLYNNNIPES